MTDTSSPVPGPTPPEAAAAVSDDPAVGLRAVRSLRTLAERLEALQVGRARALGWSWQEIADALGVSRQAVHKKHGTRRGSGLDNGRD
ncbi:helix-turn-helix domain-containing protein [Luteimicrobium sp. DT211]|uniref:helix-turn-helix domain-containing protein n=1 Tax=Luteimicrobium sp. DT211 TaxID=3393412 RepID=UPI003CF6CFA8